MTPNYQTAKPQYELYRAIRTADCVMTALLSPKMHHATEGAAYILE